MFTDPVAQVVFTSPSTGQEWTFTAPDFPFLTGVTLAYEMARKATLQLSFDAPYEEAISKLLARGTPFTLGTNVRARIGYASRPDWWTDWFGGFLNAGGDGLTLDPNGLSGQISVQVVANGAGYTLSQERLALTGTPLDMLAQCAGALGLEFAPSVDVLAESVLSSPVVELGPGGAPSPWSPSSMSNLTAWEAIKKICAMLNLHVWMGPSPTGGGNRLWVGTEREITTGNIYPGAEEQRPTFRIRGALDVPSLTFPCLTWAPEGGSASATWLAAGDDQSGKGVLLSYIDNETGKVVEVPALPEQQQVATVGAVAAVQQDLKAGNANGGEDVGDEVKGDGTPAVHVSAPMPGGDAGKQRAQHEANRRQAAGNPAQQGVITSLGLPWVVPAMLINLAGAGDMYDGPYLVQKATHTYTAGNYEMSLTCLRQGTGIDPEGEKKQTPAGAMPG